MDAIITVQKSWFGRLLRHVEFYAAFILMMLIAMAAMQPAGDAQATVLTAREMSSVRGSGGTTYETGLCLPGEVGSYCNQSDTDCGIYNPSCQEQGAGALCSTQLEFLNPTRCTTTETTKECADEGTGDPVPCFSGTDCYCELERGTLTCTVPADPPDPVVVEVDKCVLR